MTTELARLLEAIDRPGNFHTSGVSDILAPGLAVEGIGAIGLPLLDVQARQLIALSERAPYGKGAETLVDTSVRSSWQIAADKVAFQGRHWAGALDTIVARVAEGLGVAGAVKAELYKLLVYDEGGFFIEHRDTEKEEGMFGTLVIVLPSLYEGGELVIRHGGREAIVDLRCSDPSEVRFAAFYADCRHEVKPVTSGCRLTLIYNLLWPGVRPEPPAYDVELARLTTLLAQWGAEDPLKLIVPLDHAYTPAALSFDSLKGVDAARAAVVAQAAERSGCDIHLALVTIEESGSAEYSGDYRRRSRWNDDDDDAFEVGEVFERTEKLSDWRRPDGTEADLGSLPVVADEVSPPEAFDDLDPTEQSFHEATGNEGASFERTYRIAVLVLWRRRHRLAVLAQGGLAATLPALARLTDDAGGDRASPQWSEAHELSGLMIARWPAVSPWRPTPETAPFLDLLGRLGDAERIRSFLADIVAKGNFASGDADAVARALKILPPAEAVLLAERIMAGSATLEARAALLARGEGFDLCPAAAALVDSLPGRTKLTDQWGREIGGDFAVVIDIVSALARIDPALLEVAVDGFLAWPKTWDMDRVLIPAALRSGQASRRLRDACVAHLSARAALPLAPPDDWARDSRLTCSCRHCAGLARFLADPAVRIWHFRALQADRSHVESVVRNSKSDLDMTTLRKGSPHTLVCTKNQESYERLARQRRDDLALLERLSVL